MAAIPQRKPKRKPSKTQSLNRTEVTKNQLMRAAEKLFAAQGIENVSVRAIITEAGQKNESALQYHFGSLAGLIEALVKQRNLQIDNTRSELIEQMLGETDALTLRDTCSLMVRPPFLLCRTDSSFRDFLGVFGHLVITSSRSVISTLEQMRTGLKFDLRAMLRSQLPKFDDELLGIRLEDTARFATLSMSKRAREKGSFRGMRADFFNNNLIDTMAAMMAAEMSEETQALRR